MRRNWQQPFVIILLMIAVALFGFAAWAFILRLIAPQAALLLVGVFALFILVIIAAFLALMRH